MKSRGAWPWKICMHPLQCCRPGRQKQAGTQCRWPGLHTRMCSSDILDRYPGRTRRFSMKPFQLGSRCRLYKHHKSFSQLRHGLSGKDQPKNFVHIYTSQRTQAYRTHHRHQRWQRTCQQRTLCRRLPIVHQSVRNICLRHSRCRLLRCMPRRLRNTCQLDNSCRQPGL